MGLCSGKGGALLSRPAQPKREWHPQYRPRVGRAAAEEGCAKECRGCASASLMGLPSSAWFFSFIFDVIQRISTPALLRGVVVDAR